MVDPLLFDLLFGPDVWPFRHLPGGERAYVMPLTYGRGRICIGDATDAAGYKRGH